MSNKDNEYKKEIEQLNEILSPQNSKLSWAGKLFFAAVATYLGLENDSNTNNNQVPKLPIKLKGTKEQINAITNVIKASYEFQKETNRPGATVESVIQKLNAKNESKENFEKVFGKKWPL